MLEHGGPTAARSALRSLVSSLEEDHPGAASSLEESLEETLTLGELGLEERLRRTVRSTNPIENLNATMERSFKRLPLEERVDGTALGRKISAARDRNSSNTRTNTGSPSR